MSKAILVIDMPSNCSDCVLCADGYCRASFRFCYNRYDEKKETFCPLRPMPEKKEELNLNYILAEAKSREEVADGVLMSFMIDGYNACIDEIGGGANETDKETH